MIAMLKGQVVSMVGHVAVIDVGGIGYQVTVSGQMLNKLRTGSEALIYTHLQLKEDGLVLYGFADDQEKALFQRIIAVSGAGPKTALALLSALSPLEFLRAICEGNRNVLTRVSGVGKKTADRLILELKESMVDFTSDWGDDEEGMPLAVGGVHEDAIAALVSLGYEEGEATTMVEQAKSQSGEPSDVQALLKAALSIHAKRRDSTWKRNA